MKRPIEEGSYSLVLVPHPNEDKIESEKRRKEVLDLLKRMHLRAKKKGRPSKEEREFDDAA